MSSSRVVKAIVGATVLVALAIAPSPSSAADGTRVLRSWPETVSVGDTTVKGRVELVFDYDQGLAFEQILDEQGQLVERRPGPRVPTPAREEIDAAIDIVSNDPTLGAIIEAHRAYVDGGFILDEGSGKPCGPRSRCLQIFAFRVDAGEVPLFRAVVDLTKAPDQSIVYRDGWDQGVPR